MSIEVQSHNKTGSSSVCQTLPFNVCQTLWCSMDVLPQLEATLATVFSFDKKKTNQTKENPNPPNKQQQPN